jgi:hypothetical protein
MSDRFLSSMTSEVLKIDHTFLVAKVRRAFAHFVAFLPLIVHAARST